MSAGLRVTLGQASLAGAHDINQDFHGALLQPAIEAGRPIVPLALSYHDRNGRRSTAPVRPKPAISSAQFDGSGTGAP